MKESISNRIFLTATIFLAVFLVCVVGYQYRRERSYKVTLLNERLQDFNRSLSLAMDEGSSPEEFYARHKVDSLRLTVLDETGKVLYDSDIDDPSKLSNHIGRKEISDALASGTGCDIKRNSEPLGGVWFYSATYIPDRQIVIRSSLPYSHSLSKMLLSDHAFAYMALAMALLLFFILFIYKRLERSEVDRDRIKRQLTQNIAHELKTPVSSISGFLETIINTPAMPENLRHDFLQRCYSQSRRLSNLLGDISLLTRLDEASDSFAKEDVNIHDIVATIGKDVSVQLAAKKMSYISHIGANVCISGNYGLLYSIFRNLADNAVAYAGDGTQIDIKVTGEDKRYVYISFSDNGAGVPPEHLPHLFERFYRIDKGRSRKLGGTGLGLAIVKNAVLLHGGRIEARLSSSGGLEILFSLSKT